MKRHSNYFDALFMEECTIRDLQIEGDKVSLINLQDLMIFNEHPLGGGTRDFYCDGFTMVFEGVTRSVRELALYANDKGQGFERSIHVEDGPFAECNRRATTFEIGGVLKNPFSYVASWEIDAAEFYLMEPDGPWEKHGDSSAVRADLEKLRRDLKRDRQS